MNIGEKLFTYINVKDDLTSEMIEQYKSSLIFLGDEQQIYQPLTGAYIGIGISYFNQIREELANNTTLLNKFDEHVHQNVVNSLWAEFSKEEFNAVFTDSSIPYKIIAGQKGTHNGLGAGDAHYLMTNQDIVVKGLHDTTGTAARNLDELGHPYNTIAEDTLNDILWSHINRNSSSNNNFKGSSGIQVNVHHTGDYHYGVDAEGFVYSYFDGHDYLTIDDSLTWAYITSQSSYLLDYSNKVAITQANRVYHDILGGNDPVYIEKEFDEVFSFDDDGNLKQIVDGDLGSVFIHIKDTNDTTGGTYQRVNIYNANGHYYIYSRFRDPNTNQNIFYILKSDDTSNTAITNVPDGEGGTLTLTPIPSQAYLESLLFPDDGYDKYDNGTFKEIAWYNIDADATAQGQKNLADGIQTLKEVAYILDQITDGSEDGVITLTYNIANNAMDIIDLKKWKNEIGEHVVTDFSTYSNNKFVYVNSYSENKWDNYGEPSIGSTRMSIDLLLAQTYNITFNQGTSSEYTSTYAAYLNSSEHTNYIKSVWRYLGDTTNDEYYVNLKTADINVLKNNLSEALGITDPTSYLVPILERSINNITHNPQYGVDSVRYLNNLSNTQEDRYVLFNYKKSNYPVVNGKIDSLTTVDWVTTYVGWGLENLLDNVNNLNGNVKEEILTYIHDNMTVTDTPQKGQFVSQVNQKDGKIQVIRKTLPLDSILASQEVYGNDFFVRISFNYAQELVKPNTAEENYSLIYYYDPSTNAYKNPPSLMEDTPYYISRSINGFSKISTSIIDDPDGPQTITNDLLLNSGHVTYFLRTSTQKIEKGNLVDVMNFTPVDIHELLYDEPINPYLSNNVLENLYYYNNTTPIGKYIDASFRQNTDDGSTELFVTSYVTYLGAATKTNTGLADAYDVKHTIESLLTFVNLKTNKPIYSSADL